MFSWCQDISYRNLSYVQDVFYCDLSNVQDVFYCDLSNVQDVSYRNLPNVQNEPYHDSLSERDEPFQSEYCPLTSVMFSQNISASCADTCVKCSQVLVEINTARNGKSQLWDEVGVFINLFT